jgi:hypothetical protein
MLSSLSELFTTSFVEGSVSAFDKLSVSLLFCTLVLSVFELSQLVQENRMKRQKMNLLIIFGCVKMLQPTLKYLRRRDIYFRRADNKCLIEIIKVEDKNKC